MSDARSMSATLADELDAYLAAVLAGDRRSAINAALDTLEAGVPAETVITDLLARAQREIGVGWQEGRWSVAMEHRASSITESALQSVSDEAMRAPGALREGSRGHAVVACTEGEWHVLPGRMASEVLRLRGADVSFIGPSVPASELADMLGVDPPAAVAVTCSMPLSLTGSWRTISALRGLGMTVVCGGRGFGPEGRWGLAIGADLWAPDFVTGANMLLDALDADRPPPRPPVGGPEVTEELRIIARDREAFVESATAVALGAWPSLRESDAAVRATREDLDSTLKALSAAVVCSDGDIVTDFVAWFENVLANRSLPLAFCASAFDLLLGSLPEELPLTRQMARHGLDSCTVPPLGR